MPEAVIEQAPQALPQHVAIIMDGNGRWARARGLPRTEGHRQGAQAVRRTIKATMDLGIPYLTLFGFSNENWSRPAQEVDDLMGLLRRYLQSELAELHKAGVKVHVIGDRSRLPTDIVRMIADVEKTTADNRALTLTIALSYGGRQEIVEACRSLARRVERGEMLPDEITGGDVAGGLYTAGTPDPDLVIRTSGEKRISNFLLWQCAYAEFIFVDALWPDFGVEQFNAALGEFGRRDRRFGAAVGS